jgi:hypothetical protein
MQPTRDAQRKLRRAAIALVVLAVAGCTAWDRYAAGQSQKYSGAPVFAMYAEWGTPISRTWLVTGGRFYQFRKPGSDCRASVWTSDLDVILRLAVSGPAACAGSERS